MVLVLHLAFAWVLRLPSPCSPCKAWRLEPGGQAPLHALAIGFFSVDADRHGVAGYPGTFRASGAGRRFDVGGVLHDAGWPPCFGSLAELPLPGVAAMLLWLSAMTWLGAFGVWAAGLRALALAGPRTDGKPG
jgi:hypothetical protein